MSARPYADWSDAEIAAERRRLQPYVIEAARRQREQEQEARIRRAEAIISELQSGLPAGQVKLARKVDRAARASGEAMEAARLAIGGRIRLERELQAEVVERRGDRDRIEQRVTKLEMQDINRNRQNLR
jgi:hypothetical protein